MNLSTYEAALTYKEKGWRVIVAHHITDEGVCSCPKPACNSAGKHPNPGDGWQDTPEKPNTDLYGDFGETPANIGIITGEPSGIWVLDIDPKDGGDETLAALEAEHGALPATYTTATGSGGTHHYFALDGEEIVGTQGRIGPGIDTRGIGGQVVAPPSVSGVGPYSVADDVPLAVAPEWLLEQLRPHQYAALAEVAAPANPDGWLSAMLQGTADDLRQVGEGEGWDIGIWKVAVRLAEVALSDWNELTLRQAHSHLHANAPLQLKPTAQYPHPWTSENVEDKWRSAMRRAEPTDPPAKRSEGEFIPFGFAGAAFDEDGKFDPVALVDAMDADLHFKIRTDGVIYLYLDGYYQPDPGERILTSIIGRAIDAKFRGYSIREALLRIRVIAEPIDPLSNPDHVINVKNGLLDYRTGELHDHTHEIVTTIQIPVAYHPEATCPEVDAYFERTLGDPDTIRMCFEMLGYFISPTWIFKKAFMLTGPTDSGKSGFLDLAGAVVGARNVSGMALQGLSQRFGTAPLLGKLLNSVGDLPKKPVEDSSIFKQLTGGDQIQVEFKGSTHFQVKKMPVKLLFSANEVPSTTDHTAAYADRWVYVPFLRRFTPSDPEFDVDYRDKITTEAELQGALVKAVAGLRMLVARGYWQDSNVVQMHSAGVRDENDDVMRWMLEMMVPKLGADRTKATLYENFKVWCDDEGIPPTRRIYKKNFAPRLVENCERLGYEVTHHKVVGVDLLSYG